MVLTQTDCQLGFESPVAIVPPVPVPEPIEDEVVETVDVWGLPIARLDTDGTLELVERMIVEEHEHLAWLADMIDRCEGALLPAPADLRAANLHYLELDAVIPHVLRSTESLAEAYAQAGADAASLTPDAAELLTRIARRHQEHLQQLKDLQSRTVSA